MVYLTIGVQWLSGRVTDLRSLVRASQMQYVLSLSKTINLVLSTGST